MQVLVGSRHIPRFVYKHLSLLVFVTLLCNANKLHATDATNMSKEFAKNVGNIDHLCNENVELNKLNEAMSTELKSVKENLRKAEEALESEKQKHTDALRDVQDRLDKRLDELSAIDE